MNVISDVTRKFSSRYLLARRKINASDLLLTSKFGVLRQIRREIARQSRNNVHLNLSNGPVLISYFYDGAAPVKVFQKRSQSDFYMDNFSSFSVPSPPQPGR